MAGSKHDAYSDQELLSMLVNNDQQGFTLIYNKYADQLFMYVGKVIRDENAAQDIVQELFITIWTRRSELVSIDSLGAYLTTSARYKAFTYIKSNLHKENFANSIASFFDNYDDSLQETLHARELERIIDQEIANLPEKMRAVYIMSRKEQLSHKEIAEKLNIADTTVKKQIGNALKHFKIKLSRLHSFFF